MKFVISIIILFLSDIILSQSLNDHILKEINSLNAPKVITEFKSTFHNPPVNQDTTSSCWSFATTSFIESEMARLNLEPVQLSVMYPVYHIFLEKIIYFVEQKGLSRVAPGDLFHGVLDVVKKYGLIPQTVYKGQIRQCNIYDHNLLYAEIDSLTLQLQRENEWNIKTIMPRLKVILDKHLGAPPESFVFRGKKYTPRSFEDKIIRIPWDDYVCVTSFLYEPFYEYIALDVPDNWKKHTDFYNVPLPLFYQSFKNALLKKYSIAIDADISEEGRFCSRDLSFIPSFDIPLKHINQAVRELRFNNGSTTDDHLMHVVGFDTTKSRDWYLLKDSWRTAWEGANNGYIFASKDYIKLKVLAFLVHREAIPKIVSKITSQ